MYYYRFYDVGSKNYGKNLENRLYIYSNVIKGNTKYIIYSDYFTLTEVRKNNGKTY